MRDLLNELEKGFDAAANDPMRSAQASMRPKLPKRFYKDVTVGEGEGGCSVLLDGRAIRTPGRNTLTLPTLAAAQLIADEFAAQGEELDPATMPCYRLSNTARDGVATDMQAVKEDIIRFSGSDLLCYRAGEPEGLVKAQRDAWDGPLAWIEERIGQHFNLAEGVMHVSQPARTVQAFGMELRDIEDPLLLSCLHSMTTLTGSAILALAVLRGAIDAETAWNAAHVDETWQESQWGADEEARLVRARRWQEMEAARRMVAALAS